MTPRVLANDPLSAALQVLNELALVAAQTKHLPAATILEQRIRSLQQWHSRTTLDVDVAFDSSIDGARRKAILEWISPGLAGGFVDSRGQGPWYLNSATFAVRVWELSRSPVNRAGIPTPTLLVAAIDGGTKREFLERAADSHLFIILFAEMYAGPLLDERSRQSNIVHVREKEEPASFGAWIQSKGTSFAELLRAIALCKAMESLVTAQRPELPSGLVGEILDRELQGIRMRRNLLRQKLAEVQQASIAGGGLEFVTEVRGIVQRHLESFEKNLAERWNTALAPHGGPVWEKIESDLTSLTALKWTRKVKSEAAEIPQKFRQDLVRAVSNTLLSQCMHDTEALRDLWKVIEVDLEQASTRHGIPPVSAHVEYIDGSTCQQLLSRSLQFQRVYEGERHRRGGTELMMNVRQYAMVLITVLMYAGYMGFGGDWRGRPIIQGAFAMLLIYGLIQTVVTVRSERGETNERELTKAKETIRVELRRILPEIQRAWLNTLTQNLNGQIRNLLTAWETGTRTQLVRNASSLAEQRQQLQLQAQALENSERRLLPAIKARETICSALAQVLTQLRQFVPEGDAQAARRTA